MRKLKKQQERLESRRANFDAMSGKLKNSRAFKRPGSMNPKKGSAKKS